MVIDLITGRIDPRRIRLLCSGFDAGTPLKAEEAIL